MKMQPSHRLFCPHPWPRPRLPFPQPAPTGRSLFGPRPEAAPARNPNGRLKGGMPRSRSSGTDPGVGLRSLERMGTVRTGTTFDWAQETPRVPERGVGVGGGVEASKWKTEKTPQSLSPGSLPPSGHRAPGNLPSKRPPHTNTHKHTHTVRRSFAWRGFGGRNRSGRQGSGLPFQAGSRAPGKLFPPTGPRDSHGEGFQHPLEIKGCGREADAFLERKWVGLR